MKLTACLATLGLMFGTLSAHAQALSTFKIGDTVPPTLAFTDSTGKSRTFKEFQGSPLVLEWTNYECPFVKKHYSSNHMQNLQKSTVAQGVNWLSVISSAPGKQGHLTTQTAAQAIAAKGFAGTAVVLDETGTLGRQFGAETTPHMFILNKDSALVYRGAIDSIPSFSAEDLDKAENYVVKAIAELQSGKPVSTPQTKSYGCSVKY